MSRFTIRKPMAALLFVLAITACGSLLGQSSENATRNDAILDIDAITTEMASLPEKDVRTNHGLQQSGSSEKEESQLVGTIKASENLAIEEVKHWNKDDSPFSIAFEGTGALSIDLPPKTVLSGTETTAKNSPNEDVSFVTITVQPALSEDPNELSYLFVQGTVIGFGLKPERSGLRMGTAFALNGDLQRASFENWFNIGISFPVNENYEAAIPIKLALRLDLSAGEWDLYLMGRLRYAGIASGKPIWDIAYRSSGLGSTRLAELATFTSNPLFNDLDSDGIEDIEEESLGFSSIRNDRDALDELGEYTNLQHFVNLQKVYVSRARKEFETNLLEAVARFELGLEPGSDQRDREIPSEQRFRVFTEEEHKAHQKNLSVRLQRIGAKLDDPWRIPPSPGLAIENGDNR